MTRQRLPYLSSRLQGLGTTVFAEMSALALRTGAVNLGQGFPDYGGPSEVTEAAVAAIRAGENQYPPGIGTPALRGAVADHQKRFYGIGLDPDTEVLVTAGATEGITAALLALCEVGDEVLVLDPWYDSYAAAIAMAGAQRRAVPLEAPAWALDLERLSAAVTPRTRVLLLNSPHNPTGRVLSASELDAVARICVDNDLIAVTDEVYEHLVFDGAHVPLSTRPGMASRTVSVSSAGKTFSVTGWKIGWVTGSAPLVSAVRTTKQFLTYVNGAPFQPAVAVGLDLGDEVYDSIRSDLRSQRDQLCAGLSKLGYELTPPAGGYFATADARPLGATDDVSFCRELVERCGVVAIPVSAFREPGAPAASSGDTVMVRFAYCKRPEVLDEALDRLSDWKA